MSSNEEMILHYYTQGMKPTVIAKKMGIGWSWVGYIIRRDGYDNPSRKWTSGCISAILRYLDEGYPLNIIAGNLNRSVENIQQFCTWWGYEPIATKRWAVYPPKHARFINNFIRAFDTIEQAEAFQNSMSTKTILIDLWEVFPSDQLQAGCRKGA